MYDGQTTSTLRGHSTASAPGATRSRRPTGGLSRLRAACRSSAINDVSRLGSSWLLFLDLRLISQTRSLYFTGTGIGQLNTSAPPAPPPQLNSMIVRIPAYRCTPKLPEGACLAQSKRPDLNRIFSFLLCPVNKNILGLETIRACSLLAESLVRGSEQILLQVTKRLNEFTLYHRLGYCFSVNAVTINTAVRRPIAASLPTILNLLQKGRPCNQQSAHLKTNYISISIELQVALIL